MTRQLQPHQLRVADEQAALAENITKLATFFNSVTFRELPFIEQELLRDQLQAMTAYDRALRMRLSLWIWA